MENIKVKVLIVDDLETNYFLLKKFFDKQEYANKCRLYWINNGMDAIRQCDLLKLDLVLMDGEMPFGIHGLIATEKIKERHLELPIIYTSGNDIPENYAGLFIGHLKRASGLNEFEKCVGVRYGRNPC